MAAKLSLDTLALYAVWQLYAPVDRASCQQTIYFQQQFSRVRAETWKVTVDVN